MDSNVKRRKTARRFRGRSYHFRLAGKLVLYDYPRDGDHPVRWESTTSLAANEWPGETIGERASTSIFVLVLTEGSGAVL